MQPKLIKTKHGFYQFRPLPSEKSLRDYYARKYYQNPKGTSYTVRYTSEEIKYFRLKAALIYRQVLKLRKPSRTGTFLDVGCGEGWLLDCFFKNGFKVRGIDYSSFAIRKFHPRLVSYFEQGDVNELLEKYAETGKKSDVIVIANVIEHVLDPVKLLGKIKMLLAPGGLLAIVAPNDFSPLQKYLLRKKIVSRKYWAAYPDHISYFNKETMMRFLSKQGWDVLAVVADNPVDFDLLNPDSNYVEDRSKGKNSHMRRVKTDLFLAGLSEEKLLELYTTLGSMGAGRDLTYYAGIKG